MDKKIKIAITAVYVVVFAIVLYYDRTQFAGVANLRIFIPLTVMSVTFLWILKDIQFWRFGLMGGLLAVVIILSFPNVTYEEAKASVAARAELIEPVDRKIGPVRGYDWWQVFSPNEFYLFEIQYGSRTEIILVNPMTGELLAPSDDVREELLEEYTLNVGVIGNITLPEVEGVSYQSVDPKELLTSEVLRERSDLWIIDREYNELFSTPEYRNLAAENGWHVLYLESSKGNVPFANETHMLGRDTYSDYNDGPMKMMLYMHHRQDDPPRLIIKEFDLASSYSDEDYLDIMKQIQQEPFARK